MYVSINECTYGMYVCMYVCMYVLYVCMYVLRKYDSWTTNGHTVTLLMYVYMYVCTMNVCTAATYCNIFWIVNLYKVIIKLKKSTHYFNCRMYGVVYTCKNILKRALCVCACTAREAKVPVVAFLSPTRKLSSSSGATAFFFSSIDDDDDPCELTSWPTISDADRIEDLVVRQKTHSIHEVKLADKINTDWHC